MNYEEAGIATMLAGLVRAREILDKEIEAMQGKLQLAQNGGNALDAVREHRGPYRPRAPLAAEREFKRKSKATSDYWAKMSPEERSAVMKQRWADKKAKENGRGGDRYGKVSAGAKGYWAKMTPAERKAEMERRDAVRAKKWAEAANAEKLHPRDPRSPKHEAWLKKMSKVGKAAWNKMTPEQRLARQTSMHKGHAKKHVNGEAAA